MKKGLVFSVVLLVALACNVCFAGRVQMNETWGAEKFVEGINETFQYYGRRERFVDMKYEGLNSEGFGVYKATYRETSDVYGTLTIWANPDGYIYQWRLSSNGRFLSDTNVHIAAGVLATWSATESMSSMPETAYQRGESVQYCRKTERYYRLWTKKNNQGGITYIMEAYDEM